MQNKELSHPKKKMDIKVDYTSSQPVQPLAHLQNSLPHALRDKYSEQPWRRTGPLKTVDFHIYVYIYFLLGLVQQLTNLTAASSHLIKGDLFL